METLKVFLITATLSCSFLFPYAASSIYECEPGAMGYVLVSDHDGSPIFWLGKKTGDTVDYASITCMLAGNMKVLVLGAEKEL